MLTSLKKHRPKWSKVYIDKIESHKAKAAKEQNRSNESWELMQAASLIRNKLSKFIRSKMADKSFSCRRTLENLRKPVSFDTYPLYDEQWDHTLLCIVCNTPVTSEFTRCRSCNVVIHNACETFLSPSGVDSNTIDANSISDFQYTIDDSITELSHRTSNISLYTTNLLRAEDPNAQKMLNTYRIDSISELVTEALASSHANSNENHFTCFMCREAAHADTHFFKQWYAKIKEERIMRLYEKLIKKQIVAYIEKKKFHKRKKALVIFQASLRRRKYTKVHEQWMVQAYRVAVLEVLSLPIEYTCFKDSIIVLTVINAMNHGVQYFRFDKKVDKALAEGFLLCGITSSLSVVVSYGILKDDYQKLYILIGQAQFFFRDLINILSGQEKQIRFTEKISWMPMDITNQTEILLKLPTPADAQLIQNYKNYVHSVLREQHSNHHHPHHPHHPHAHPEKYDHDEHARRSSSSAIPHHRPSLLVAAADSAHQASVNSNSNEEKELLATIKYIPLNRITSFCKHVTAPPLDLLRRPGEDMVVALANAKKKNKPSSHLSRTTKWWICFCERILYFYQYYGDCKARFAADMTTATVVRQREVGQHCNVTVSFADGRNWLFEFDTKYDAIRFELAATESKKAFNSPEGSIYVSKTRLKLKPLENNDFINTV